MKKVKYFLVLSFLALFLINLSLISSYILVSQYGSVTLNPGERYTVNIPFFGSSRSPVICGVAETTSGTRLSGVNVTVQRNSTIINKSTTDSNGEYCVILPEITSSRKYDIYIEYNPITSDGDNLTLGSNDYTLGFDNNKVYSRSEDDYVFLSGVIENEDAEVDEGRFEINLQYWPSNSSERYEVFDYRKYFVNIEPNEIYNASNNELNVFWEIPNNADLGRYKFYIKTSFNAKERTKDVFFNLTA